jgi:anti-sigma-K factor RskA
MTVPMSEENHNQLRAQLPELAVGVLDGRDRSLLLDHVGECASCTAELEDLTTAADSLVQLAPEVDPPVGFESRIFDQIRATPTPITSRSTLWHKRPLQIAAVVVVLALAFGIGWAVHPTPSTVPRTNAVSAINDDHVDQASLVSEGQSYGKVSLYAGSPGWLFMTVSSADWSGKVWCTVTSKDGTTKRIGSFDLVNGQGAWGVPLATGAESVASAQVVAADGTVLAQAHFD